MNRAAYYRAHQQATSRDDIELRDAPAHRLGDAWLRSRRITASCGGVVGLNRTERFQDSAVPAAGPTRAYDRFAARAGLFEPGSRAPLTGLNQLWVAESPIFGYCASSFTWRCCWTATRGAAWLVTGPHAGDGADAGSFADGLGEARRGACTGATDRGVQYAAGDYTALGRARHRHLRKASPNDSQSGVVYQDAQYEEVYLFEYRITPRRSSASRSSSSASTMKNGSSALDYRPPNELSSGCSTSRRRRRYEFSTREIYRSDGLGFRESGARSGGLHAPTHRFVSFQPAIPWRVALPQSPLPLHQPSRSNEGHSPAKLFSANGETLLSRLSLQGSTAHMSPSQGTPTPVRLAHSALSLDDFTLKYRVEPSLLALPES